jgi:hypothetical protein
MLRILALCFFALTATAQDRVGTVKVRVSADRSD